MGRTSDARQRLIDSAHGLMHERGFTAVGVSEVCGRAGVNKGSFYHFFPSKQDLALAVIDRYAEEMLGLLDEMTDADGLALDRLKEFFDRNYRYHKSLREEHGICLGCPLGNLALEMSSQDPVVRDRLRLVFERYVDALDRLLSSAVERGELGKTDTRKTATALLALHEGRVMLAKLNDDPEFLRGLGDEALRLVGAG